MQHINSENLRLKKLAILTKQKISSLRRENYPALAEVIDAWSKNDEVFSLTGDSFTTLAEKIGKDLPKADQAKLATILKELISASINKVYNISSDGKILSSQYPAKQL